MAALYQYVGSSRLPSQLDDLFTSFARMLKKRLGAGYGNKITQRKRERASFECPYQNTLGS
jgi:hypothetical protein